MKIFAFLFKMNFFLYVSEVFLFMSNIVHIKLIVFISYIDSWQFDTFNVISSLQASKIMFSKLHVTQRDSKEINF